MINKEQILEQARKNLWEQCRDQVYICHRVWEAWQYGTMTRDDFEPAEDNDEWLEDTIENVVQVALSQYKEELKEKIEEMKEYKPHIGIGHLHEADLEVNRNETIDDILSLLK